MQFLPSEYTYSKDKATQAVWGMLTPHVATLDGICYYRHPVIAASAERTPDLTLLAEGFNPVVVVCRPYLLEELESIDELTWRVNGQEGDSPLLDLEDYVLGLTHRFDREREIRHLFKPLGALALPLITRPAFEEKFGPDVFKDFCGIFKDSGVEKVLQPLPKALQPLQWRHAKSVFQGVQPLNRGKGAFEESAPTLGGAITILEREIALLDDEQHKVAVQIAPGPQRIRGLAGTGKTVVLAMKAANIHLRYPDARILFTFNTQSLYNQARALITKFYRYYSETDPNWDNLHVRHGWGSANRPGVYSEACRRLGATPLNYSAARALNAGDPFKPCCEQALKLPLKPVYDFVLMDEAQDFPQEFFRLVAQLTQGDKDKKIYFAYDELQSLTKFELPPAEELFGTDAEGLPVVTLGGDDYEGGIEKDFVLHRSYRCPHEVLMLAHGIGLGIHAARGIVQMLGNQESWIGTGYEVVKGGLKAGEHTVICRPPENSPNRILDIYTGPQALVTVEKFENRGAELEWVANQIADDINVNKVKPEHIIVISLSSRQAKEYLVSLQQKLINHAVLSTIPGLVDDSSEFAEPDRVTLSTIHRAKGNEAPIVYIIGFEALFSYVEEMEYRNRAFTAISRAKGWVRITGVGQRMVVAKQEIEDIIGDVPCFNFTFPDMATIARRLDASETSRRRKEVRRAQESAERLVEVDRGAIEALDPELRKRLRELLDRTEDVGE